MVFEKVRAKAKDMYWNASAKTAMTLQKHKNKALGLAAVGAVVFGTADYIFDPNTVELADAMNSINEAQETVNDTEAGRNILHRVESLFNNAKTSIENYVTENSTVENGQNMWSKVESAEQFSERVIGESYRDATEGIESFNELQSDNNFALEEITVEEVTDREVLEGVNAVAEESGYLRIEQLPENDWTSPVLQDGKNVNPNLVYEGQNVPLEKVVENETNILERMSNTVSEKISSFNSTLEGAYDKLADAKEHYQSVKEDNMWKESAANIMKKVGGAMMVGGGLAGMVGYAKDTFSSDERSEKKEPSLEEKVETDEEIEIEEFGDYNPEDRNSISQVYAEKKPQGYEEEAEEKIVEENVPSIEDFGTVTYIDTLPKDTLELFQKEKSIDDKVEDTDEDSEIPEKTKEYVRENLLSYDDAMKLKYKNGGSYDDIDLHSYLDGLKLGKNSSIDDIAQNGTGVKGASADDYNEILESNRYAQLHDDNLVSKLYNSQLYTQYKVSDLNAGSRALVKKKAENLETFYNNYFDDNGNSELSASEIAEEMGLSTSTIYNYRKDLQDMMGGNELHFGVNDVSYDMDRVS